ncbi:hypothetical protein CPB84DRAFT_1799624, partial [Gymnopilus junonius]
MFQLNNLISFTLIVLFLSQHGQATPTVAIINGAEEQHQDVKLCQSQDPCERIIVSFSAPTPLGYLNKNISQAISLEENEPLLTTFYLDRDFGCASKALGNDSITLKGFLGHYYNFSHLHLTI